MADAAAARREARRRKILDNSQNRLQRISGKCEEEVSKGSPVRTLLPEESSEVSALPESSFHIPSISALNNGVVGAGNPSLGLFSPIHQLSMDATGDGLSEITNELAALTSPTPEPTTTQIPTFWNKLILYKYDVVLLSMMVQVLYSFSMLSFNDTYFFLPLAVFVVTKSIWFPPPNSSNFANTLLLMNGISIEKVERIMSVTCWVTMFSQDLCVYLFATICMQALYITIKNYLTT